MPARKAKPINQNTGQFQQHSKVMSQMGTAVHGDQLSCVILSAIRSRPV